MVASGEVKGKINIGILFHVFDRKKSFKVKGEQDTRILTPKVPGQVMF